jgi:hypothetical protein
MKITKSEAKFVLDNRSKKFQITAKEKEMIIKRREKKNSKEDKE